jgi:hypothetical protein
LSRYLNIVAFDVPFPANYGGVIDVYYKLVWLKKQGVKVILHCFMYGRQPAPVLETLCEKVYYYRRRTGLLSNFSLLPYTVRSRQNKELLRNLELNNFPILFEVLHTCYLMKDKKLRNRKKIYRHSNIEHVYYTKLAESERGFLKKLYLRTEAFKLARFEKILRHANLILAVNEQDTAYFRQKYPEVESVYLPSFHPSEDINIAEGRGDYLLFHGNLSISENYEAAAWLIHHVFSRLSLRTVIAGLNPPLFLRNLIRRYPHMELRANPDEREMNELVRRAHVHVLSTAQPTGLKLKLLNVLFNGRFIVCNAHMTAGTGLGHNEGFYICSAADSFVSNIKKLMTRDFDKELAHERKLMVERFSNAVNAGKLTACIFDGD